MLIVCHTLRFRLHGTQTFHICHCRGHFPFNIFPTEKVGASKPTRTLCCKRLRVLCLHYFLDKDFVQLDPATAAQLIPSNLIPSNHLIRSHLIRSHLIQSSLIQSNLIQSNLIQSNLIQSNLIQSNLIQSNLIQSNPIQSNLIQSNLIQSNPI